MKLPSLHQMADEIFEGKISAEACAETFCETAKELSHLNVLASWDEEALLDAARATDSKRKKGELAGPLHGIPLILKDNINTVDLPTSAGTPSLIGNVPAANATLVERLFAAGGLLGGKANLHELSSGGTSANHVFGSVCNPYDPSCIAGGSSGGVAAGVAAGLVPAGIGTDTAGSVRVPAALCGVVGFRPTVGRYSAQGIVPLSRSIDTAGPIARTVQDIEILDAVLSGMPIGEKRVNLSAIRLGVTYDLIESSSEEVRLVFDNALKTLRNAGVLIVPIALETMRDMHRAASAGVIDTEFKAVMSAYLSDNAPQIELWDLVDNIASPAVREFTRSRLVKTPDVVAYNHAVSDGRAILEFEWEKLLKENQIDAVIFPTTPEVALPLHDDDTVLRNGEPTSSWIYFNHTSFASFGRRPGITIPIGLSKSGLPVGLELDGLPGLDSRLLTVARAVEGLFESMPAPSF